MEVGPLDAILTQEGVWCFVEELFWGNAPYRCRPKYVPTEIYRKPFMGHFWLLRGREYTRLGTREDVDHIQSLLPNVFDSQGLLVGSSVKEVISTSEGKAICKANTHSTVSSAASELIQILVDRGVPNEKIGVTGSVLLDGAIDGFSDIDLVIKGSDAIIQSMSVLREAFTHGQSGLYYRDLEAARQFYHKYQVTSQLTDYEFALHFTRKFAQGIIYDVPFTIFTVPDRHVAADLSVAIESLEIEPYRVKFTTRVVDATDANYVPISRYILQNPNGSDSDVIYLYCLDRACIDQAREGDLVFVDAHPAGSRNYIVRPRDGVIKNLSIIEKS